VRRFSKVKQEGLMQASPCSLVAVSPCPLMEWNFCQQKRPGNALEDLGQTGRHECVQPQD